MQVISVERNGPTHKAGVAEGDILLALNGGNVATVDDVHRLLAGTLAGSSIALTVLRGSERWELTVITGEA